MLLPRPTRGTAVAVTCFCVVITLVYSAHFFYQSARPSWSQSSSTTNTITTTTAWQQKSYSIINETKQFVESPIEPPYKDKFRELGERTKKAREWIRFIDSAPPGADKQAALEAVEAAITSLYPYLAKPPNRPDTKTPFSDLRASIVPGSRGIVLPTGKGTLRFALHLIGSLRDVLHSSLPVQIVYAGDEDLPAEDRARVQARFGHVEFLDMLSVMDDTTTNLTHGGWAIKTFAALYSPFEHVLLLDADCVFVQQPELLFETRAYRDAGALIFRDRLLWQHFFPDRHKWYLAQVPHPSAELNTSLVYTQDYAEEADSGAVVVDKSRLEVLTGLLHVSWQNTERVREDVTYRMTYGDKESWWFGLELCGAAYAFERHYAAMVGWVRDRLEDGRSRICSFVIGHVDAADELFWYNGGLLENKRVDQHKFGIPTDVMVDGTWEKGGVKEEMSCMVGNNTRPVRPKAKQVLEKSVELAKALDSEFGFV